MPLLFECYTYLLHACCREHAPVRQVYTMALNAQDVPETVPKGVANLRRGKLRSQQLAAGQAAVNAAAHADAGALQLEGGLGCQTQKQHKYRDDCCWYWCWCCQQLPLCDGLQAKPPLPAWAVLELPHVRSALAETQEAGIQGLGAAPACVKPVNLSAVT